MHHSSKLQLPLAHEQCRKRVIGLLDIPIVSQCERSAAIACDTASQVSTYALKDA